MSRFNAPWTDAEVAILREMWPSPCTVDAIAHKLPGRFSEAVSAKARHLGLGRKMLERAGGWTDERVALMTKLYQDGYSYGQIAKELGNGVTRNAVTGQVSRRKLGGFDRPSHPSRLVALPGKSTKPRKPWSETNQGKGLLMKSPKAPPVKRGPTNPSAVGMRHAGDGSGHAPRAYVKRGGPVESPNPVDIMGLGPRMCKAVIEDDPTVYYCGNAKPHDATYCPAHAACYYLPSQPKKMRPDSRW